jgi:hypothetical protein
MSGSWRGGVALLIVCGALFAPRAAGAKNSRTNDPALRRWLGARTVDVIGDAERAEIVQVDDTPIADGPTTIGGYPTRGDFRPVDRDLLEGFRAQLLDPRTYGGTIGKLCGGFHPGVALRFWPKGTKRGAKPADILICFHCDELASVPTRASERLTTVDVGPGRLALLRLAAAALPGVESLASTFAREQNENAHRLLFDSMLPPDVLVALDVASRSWAAGREVEAANLLRRRYSGAALFVVAARALAAKGRYGDGDVRTAAIYAATRTLTGPDIAAGLDALRGDQVALAGAGELLLAGGLTKNSDADVAWAPVLAEAMFVRKDWGCHMLREMTKRGGRALTPLLVRLRRGQVPIASRWAPRSPYEPSMEGCATMVLAEVDPATARAELDAWRPARPIDVLAARAARLRIGDAPALDAELFTSRQSLIVDLALDGVRAHPSREALDLLVANALEPSSTGQEAQSVFLTVTGATLSLPTDADANQRVLALRAWWSKHRTTWQPPSRRP